MRKDVRLGTKITFSLVIVMVFILAMTIFILINNTSNAVESTISNQSIQTAENIASFIDADQYEKFLASKKESSDYWQLREQLNDMREKTGSFYVYTLAVDEEKNVMMYIDGLPKDSDIASSIGEPTTATTYKDIEPALKGEVSHTEIVHDPEFGDYLSAFVPIKSKEGNVIGVLGVDIDARSVGDVQKAVITESLPIFLVLNIMAIILAGIGFSFYVKRQLKVLPALSGTANVIAQGDLVKAESLVKEHQTKSSGELRDLTVSFDEMIKNTREMILNISATSKNLMDSAQLLHGKFTELNDASGKISNAVSEVASGNVIQLERTNESQIAIEQMTLGIQNIAESASQVSESSQEMMKKVDQGDSELSKLMNQMDYIQETVSRNSSITKELGEQVSEIELIVKVISNIADETNLLALNAAIEAARAGDQGKGFAVVADEVRKLAEQSKKSAAQISQLISKYQHTTLQVVREMDKGMTAVETGAEAVHTAGVTFKEIFEAIEKVNEELQEVTATTEEMSASSEELSASIDEVAHLSQLSATHSTEVAESTSNQMEVMAEIKQSTALLQQLSEQMNEMVKKFNV